jgi:hypothetical protein
LDIETLRNARLGQFLASQVETKLAKPTADLKQLLDFDFDWRRITSATAYGTDFQPQPGKGVLLVYTDLDARKALETAIDRLQAGNATSGGIRRLEPDPLPMYLLNNDLYVAVQPGKPLMLSKFHQEILKAREVLSGQSPSLQGATTFTDLPQEPGTFFFLAAAQGISERMHIPPKAQVLKMADSLRLVLGEAADKLCLDAVLKTKTPESCQQVQQVLQGLVALALLSQTQNPDLLELAQSAKVSASGQTVNLRLQFSVARAIERIKEQEQKKHSSSGEK